MSVTVIHPAGVEVVKNGDRWIVDLEGHLVIYPTAGDGSALAQFARAAWIGVKRSD